MTWYGYVCNEEIRINAIMDVSIMAEQLCYKRGTVFFLTGTNKRLCASPAPSIIIRVSASPTAKEQGGDKS
jgi:hypothetical protein